VHGLGSRYGPHHPVSVVVECERQRQDDDNYRPWSRREEAPRPPRSAIFDPTPAHDKHAIFERHHIPFCSICCSKINNNARLFMVGAEKISYFSLKDHRVLASIPPQINYLWMQEICLLQLVWKLHRIDFTQHGSFS
jgi:hypothetical protein